MSFIEKIESWKMVSTKTNPEHLIASIMDIVKDYDIDGSNVVNDFVHCMCISFFSELTTTTNSSVIYTSRRTLLSRLFNTKKFDTHSVEKRLTVFRLVQILKTMYPSSDDGFYYDLMQIKRTGKPVAGVPYAINLMGIFIHFVDNPTGHMNSVKSEYNDATTFYYTDAFHTAFTVSAFNNTSEIELALTILVDTHYVVKGIVDVYESQARKDAEVSPEELSVFNIHTEITSPDDIQRIKFRCDESINDLFNVITMKSDKNSIKEMKELMDTQNIKFFLEPNQKMLNYFKLIN